MKPLHCLAALLVACAAVPSGVARAAEVPPVVLELFTSQGCSSCPSADALLERLAQQPGVLPLSFHVSYWDNLGWADPYASAANTNRQYAYAKSIGHQGVFTPQLIVGGTLSMVGSDESAARAAIAKAANAPMSVALALAASAQGFTLTGASGGNDLWEVRFVRHAQTKVGAGENGGQMLDSVNNVIVLRALPALKPGESQTLPPLVAPADGLAVFAQAPNLGAIKGAAVILK